MKKFHEEFSKDGLFQLVIVNCDRSEKAFAEHLKEFSWCHALPYDALPSIIESLEDKANASVIPKLAVFSVEKGFEKCVVMDVKHKIIGRASMAEAVE